MIIIGNNSSSSQIPSQMNVQSSRQVSPAREVLPDSTAVSPETNGQSPQINSTQLPGSGKLSEPAGAKDETEKGKADESSGGKSFAYGALGMDHPDEVGQKEDDSYTAGQYLKAAATIGSVIALFV